MPSLKDQMNKIARGIEENVMEIIKINYEQLIDQDLDSVLNTLLTDALVAAGTKAAEMTEEYNYQPLIKHLAENLASGEHVIIKNGRVERLFNEAYAGSPADLLKGAKEAGGHTGKPTAPFIWKVGIYMPGREGTTQLYYRKKTKSGKRSKKRTVSKLPTYEEVINKRLAAWGEKAPYWYMIEHGTSGGRSYPNFSGTHFVERFKASAVRIIEKARKLLVVSIEKFINDEISQRFKTGAIPEKGTTVVIERWTFESGLQVTKKRSSRGNIFYGIKGYARSISPSELVSELERLL